MRSHVFRRVAALALSVTMLLPASTFADEEEAPPPEADIDLDAASAPATVQQQAEQQEHRAVQADQHFEAIMQMNAPKVMLPPAPSPSTASPMTRYGGKAATGWDEGGRSAAPAPAISSEADVPLARYIELLEQVKKRSEVVSKPISPAVVLGSAEYRGEARRGALALTLKLNVTLGAPGRWKTVPLVGDDVVVVSAKAGNVTLPVARLNGYHVWVTQETGEKELTLELLVPPRGPRGSIEYDLLVDRTPITRFICRFPVARLEPRLDEAVQAEVQSGTDDTVLTATARPTTHLHLVGFRDLGEGTAAQAKRYAESLNLLSVEEGAIDVFSVIRYTILYGATKDFQVLVPPGMTVVSADGEGAFHYTLEKVEQGTLVRGETAFPIRNAYEISLRLHRDLPRGLGGTSQDFWAPLPRSQGVERESGWLGVEVPGELKLETDQPTDVFPVDVRQLPPEMVESAVSPILRAFRYHSAKAGVHLIATRLPEKDPTSASIDRVRAFTVVSAEGRVLTDLRITLRNRLRHSLTLTPPAGAQVLSTLLDGQPVKPSRDESGKITLPLLRSSGSGRLQPFTLQVVLEQAGPPLGWFGAPSLSLPAVDLPSSSLAWTVFVPALNQYSSLQGDVSMQRLSGEGTWAPMGGDATGSTLPGPGFINGRLNNPVGGGGRAATQADTGAMPVRIKLPETGVRLEYTRFWNESDVPVQVSFTYLRSWLLAPIVLLLALLLATGLLVIDARSARWERVLGAGAALVAVIGLLKVSTVGVVVLTSLAVLARVAWRRHWVGSDSRVLAWFVGLPASYRTWASGHEKPPFHLGRLVLALSLAAVVLLLLEKGEHLLMLLTRPLGG
jgi:hypothetical protein